MFFATSFAVVLQLPEVLLPERPCCRLGRQLRVRVRWYPQRVGRQQELRRQEPQRQHRREACSSST